MRASSAIAIPIVDPNAIGLLITQSGETADTLAAQREMTAQGREDPGDLQRGRQHDFARGAGHDYTNAGPEIGVASTKAFTAQLTALFLLALHLAQQRGTISDAESSRAGGGAEPRFRARSKRLCAARDRECEHLAKHFSTRGTSCSWAAASIFPIALEGALKLKEISYIHAEGYPAGEMKHGPNALIDETLPVVVVATQGREQSGVVLRYEKTLSNIQEVSARVGPVIAIATEGDAMSAAGGASSSFRPAPEMLLPLIEVVPLQLLAYHIAVRRGCDVDQPRNLAKSVTVE